LAETEATFAGRTSPQARSKSGRPPARNLTQHREREREEILKALHATKWNRTQAAKLIGMARRTLHRRLEALGLNRDEANGDDAG
jgi:transcriptional regulator of acetoin/glycerol metabolism